MPPALELQINYFECLIPKAQKLFLIEELKGDVLGELYR